MAEGAQGVLVNVDACLDRWKRRGTAPLFIGIGGGSASGKTTLALQMADLLAPLRVTVINQDRFFKPNEEKPKYFSKIYREERPDYNRPDSFRVEEMIAFCRGARDGGGAEAVILEGILALHFPELRDLMDLKVFVHADADERIVRRIRRNLPKSSFDDIANYYLESVRYRHREFCEPTRSFCDAVIDGGMASDEERTRTVEEICRRIRALFKAIA
jgi:uridine kinase